jgi:hypothetical protein
MSGPVGPDPFVDGVPDEFGPVPHGHVVHVDERLVLALPVPHLPARVARVGQDGAHRHLRPGDTGAVPVTRRIMGRRAGYAVGGQVLGDGEEPAPGQVRPEDPLDHGCGDRIQIEAV